MSRGRRRIAPWIALAAIVLGATVSASWAAGRAGPGMLTIAGGDDVTWQCAPASRTGPNVPPRTLLVAADLRHTPGRAPCARRLAPTALAGLDRPPLYVLHGVFRV